MLSTSEHDALSKARLRTEQAHDKWMKADREHRRLQRLADEAYALSIEAYKAYNEIAKESIRLGRKLRS